MPLSTSPKSLTTSMTRIYHLEEAIYLVFVRTKFSNLIAGCPKKGKFTFIGKGTLSAPALNLTFNILTLRLSERPAMLASAFPSGSKVSEANM